MEGVFGLMEKPVNNVTENKIFETEAMDESLANNSEATNLQKGEDTDDGVETTKETDNFMELYEESLKSIQEGEVVKGEIVQIDK